MDNKICLPTTIEGLRLLELTGNDAEEYFGLVEKNKKHLTHHGDYQEYKDISLQDINEMLIDPEDKNEKFGIWLDNVLIGRVDLSPRKPGDYVLGYWLSKEYAGQGYATVACNTLINYGKEQLGAKAIFAGVTKGNKKSIDLLKRLKFEEFEDKNNYTLFRLSLNE